MARGLGGIRYNFQSHIPSDLLPLARLYFLKTPQLPKVAPPARDQVFIHISLCGTYHIQIIMIYIHLYVLCVCVCVCMCVCVCVCVCVWIYTMLINNTKWEKNIHTYC
jgi:hypothetical protein